MKITVDIQTLSRQEREELAGFIMTFGVERSAADDGLDSEGPSEGDFSTPTNSPALFVQQHGLAIRFDKATEGAVDFLVEVVHPPFALTTPELTMPAPPPPNPTLAVADVTATAISSEKRFTAPITAPVSIQTASLDKSGLPWDERIHAGSKVLTADGMWRRRRGVDDAAVAAIESELRGILPATVAQSGPVLVVGDVSPPPPPPPPSADLRGDFVKLAQIVTAARAANKITAEEVTSVCQEIAGVSQFALLATKLDFVPAVAQAVDALIASR